MSGGRAVALVARREFSERLRQRSFQVSTAVTLLIVAAIAVLGGLTSGDDSESYEVGTQGVEAAAVARAADSLGSRQDISVQARPVRTEAAARTALEDDELDAVLTANGELLTAEEAPAELERLALASPKIAGILAGRAPDKVIVAGGGKLINIVVRDA